MSVIPSKSKLNGVTYQILPPGNASNSHIAPWYIKPPKAKNTR